MAAPNMPAPHLAALRAEVRLFESVTVFAGALGAVAVVFGGGTGAYLAAKTHRIYSDANFQPAFTEQQSALGMGVAVIILSLVVGGLAGCVAVVVNSALRPRRMQLEILQQQANSGTW